MTLKFAATKRIMKEVAPTKIGHAPVDAINEYLETVIREVTDAAYEIAKYRKKKTITEDDIRIALKVRSLKNR